MHGIARIDAQQGASLQIASVSPTFFIFASLFYETNIRLCIASWLRLLGQLPSHHSSLTHIQHHRALEWFRLFNYCWIVRSIHQSQLTPIPQEVPGHLRHPPSTALTAHTVIILPQRLVVKIASHLQWLHLDHDLTTRR
jgi:hypothetical protein